MLNSLALPNSTTIAAKSAISIGFIGNQCKKADTNYQDLEPCNKFWNRVRVSSS